MENKSFYFKWNSMKGFYKKYSEMFKNEKDYDISESIEHRSQIYTRYFLLFLYKNKEKGICSREIDNLITKMYNTIVHLHKAEEYGMYMQKCFTASCLLYCGSLW